MTTSQLPRILLGNAFNILGISSSSALKEIRKRSQQLLQFAKIEETQEFDTDIGDVRDFRNESEIRMALEKVFGIKERLNEIFFWFDDYSVESLKAISRISEEDYQGALEILEREDQGKVDWLKRKNLALALMFHAFASSGLDSFCRSLDIWKRIAESEDFWKFYEKHYFLHDELGTSSSLFQEFRGSICEILSVKAVAFYHHTENPKAISICYSAFGRIARVIDIEILQPIVSKIKKEIEVLEKIESSSDGNKISDTDENLINLVFKKIDEYFLELDEFSLFEYSPLIVLRNDSAEKLKSVCIGMYNQDSISTELALSFLDQCSRLTVSEAIADRIKADRRQLQENEEEHAFASRCDQIKALIASGKIKESKSAYLGWDDELARQDGEFSESFRVRLLIQYCCLLIEKGHELFDKKKFGITTLAIDGLLNRKSRKDAIRAFEQAAEILKEHLHLLVFINPAADRVALSKIIETAFTSLKNCELVLLLDYHQFCLQTIEDTANSQENEDTQVVIKLFGIAVCFSILYRRMYGVTRRKMWNWIGCAAFAITCCFFVVMNNDQLKSLYPVSSSSKKMTYEEKRVIGYLQEHNPAENGVRIE